MQNKLKTILTVCIAAAFVAVFTVWSLVKQPSDFSEAERRYYAKLPELTGESIVSGKWMDDYESYLCDQFPIRDTFRSAKAFYAYNVYFNMDNNGIYFADGHIGKIEYPLHPELVQRAADKFKDICGRYGMGKNVYFSVIPDKNYFIAEKNGYLSLDYAELTDMLAGALPDYSYIELFDLLDAGIYYNTDTHWRQELLIPVADRLANAMGTTLTHDYTFNTLERPFVGVYAGQSAMPYEPDTLEYVTGDILDNCTVTYYDTGAAVEGELYNMEKAQGTDAYEIYLSGSSALVTIENPACTSGRELIMFRDSFGGSIAPLLVSGYSKITVVDIRYVNSAHLGQYIEFDDQDMLFLYSTVLLNNSAALN